MGTLLPTLFSCPCKAVEVVAHLVRRMCNPLLRLRMYSADNNGHGRALLLGKSKAWLLSVALNG
jgi:hypothetical protein